MGSHIPIRQLRRSSVNARPRGATFRGLVASAVFTNACATSPPLYRFSVSKRSLRCSSATVGVASAEQRYLFRILRFSVFPVGLV